MGKQKNTDVCSFCGRPMPDMFSGMEEHVLICSDCIESGHHMVEAMRKARVNSDQSINLDSLPTPQAIKDFLDLYVIGQEEAKRFLSVAVYKRKAISFSSVLPERVRRFSLGPSRRCSRCLSLSVTPPRSHRRDMSEKT